MMTLSMRLAETFLELWLVMTFLELWLGLEGKYVVVLDCGLMILVTDVSMQVMARVDGLHLIRQSQIVASDVANLVSRVRIVIRIRNST